MDANSLQTQNTPAPPPSPQKKDFLTSIFEILQIPADKHEQLKNDFTQILTYNLATAVLNNLPQDKKSSFVSLVNSGKVDDVLLAKWAEENHIAGDKELGLKFDQTMKKTFDDYLGVLVKGATQKKKEDIINVAKNYLQ